ncbi:MAG: hypothetical protein ACF8PN_05955 [Phycisphaerales bacterium]
MLDAIKQWILFIIAVALAVPVANWALAGFEGPHGRDGVPMLLAASPFGAIIRMLVASAWFGLLAVVTGVLSHRYTGAFVFGFLWIVIAYRTATVEDVLRLLDGVDRGVRGSFILLAVECFIWALPAAVVTLALGRLAPNRYPDEKGPLAPVSLQAFGGACLLGLGLVWLIARTNLKGQALGAVIVGLALAVMIVRLARPRANGLLLFATPLVVGVVGYLIGAFVMSGGGARIIAEQRVWALARPLPIDFIGAGIAGVSLGIFLARSFGPEEDAPPISTKPAAPPASTASA